MAHPIHTIRRVCAERKCSAEDLLSALLHPVAVEHRQIKGFRANEPAAQRFTIVDHVRDVTKKLGYDGDPPGTILQLLSLMAMKLHSGFELTGTEGGQIAQSDVAYLLLELIRESEEDGKEDRRRMQGQF